jgi:hypothetical protein
MAPWRVLLDADLVGRRPKVLGRPETRLLTVRTRTLSHMIAGKVDATAKAAKAAKAVKKGGFKRTRKPRYSVVFHRPKTLQHSRVPKYPRTRCETPTARGVQRRAQSCGDSAPQRALLSSRCYFEVGHG